MVIMELNEEIDDVEASSTAAVELRSRCLPLQSHDDNHAIVEPCACGSCFCPLFPHGHFYPTPGPPPPPSPIPPHSHTHAHTHIHMPFSSDTLIRTVHRHTNRITALCKDALAHVQAAFESEDIDAAYEWVLKLRYYTNCRDSINEKAGDGM
jgi:hypothetical protein